MRFISGLALTLAAALALSGCVHIQKPGHKPKKKGKDKPAAEEGQTEMIGVVEMVNPEQNYVLIRCDQPQLSLSKGAELVAVDASGAQSKLVLTPERKGLYLTADIKSGSPQVANQVLRELGAAPPSKTTPATTPPPSPAAPQVAPAPTPEPIPSQPVSPPAGAEAPAPTLEPVVR